MIGDFRQRAGHAAEGEYIIPAFNVFGYEFARAVINAAEKLRAPVFLMTNRLATAHMPVSNWGALLRTMAEESTVPVCLHLDHTSDTAMIRMALDSGYTSVMYDGSQDSLDRNIDDTGRVVEMARKYGALVEGEIGSVAYMDKPGAARSIYTDPEEAGRFARETECDLVAVAVGTVHRMQSRDAVVRFDLLKAIEDAVAAPLVIHGVTGVSDADIRKMTRTRVAKANIGTALRLPFITSLRDELSANRSETDILNSLKRPMEMVEAAAMAKITLLRADGKA